MALLRTGLWFGLLAGLVEGLVFLLVKASGRAIYATAEIVWISAVFDTLLFGLVGLCFVGVARLVPRLPVAFLATASFALLAWLAWLAVGLSPFVHRYALALLAVGLGVQSAHMIRRWQAGFDRFTGRSLKWLAAIGLAALVVTTGGRRLREHLALASLPAAPAGAPNVLVIVLDALRADHLSSYGYARPTSPNIDRLAREGVLFERAFSTSSYTLASHASMLTGLYPNRHRTDWLNPRGYWECECENLASFLRETGYRTAAFSANQFWFTHERGFGRGFIRFDDFFHSLADMALRTMYGRAVQVAVLPRLGLLDVPARRRAPDINEATLDWIGDGGDHPFFVFLNYFDIHDPYLPPPPYDTRFSERGDEAGLVNWRVSGLDPRLTPEERQSEIDAYDGAIAYVDDHVARLVAALEQRGLADSTLVIITSDHGEAFDEHGLYLHGRTLYREVIHVPLVFWQPGRLPAGRVVEWPVSNASIPATVVDLIGSLGENPFSGSLAPRIVSAAGGDGATARQEPPAYPLAELVRKPWAIPRAPVFHGAMKSLVSPRWHYIENETLGAELYDWAADPLEANNLAGRPEFQPVVEALSTRLRTPPRRP